MFIFAYSRDWADVVVSQLAATAGSPYIKDWGFAAVVIGSDWEDVIERRYLEVDEAIGPYLHVFSLMPAPVALTEERLRRVQASQSVPGSKSIARQFLVDKILEADRYKLPDREVQVREKIKLLSDLRMAGLGADEDADFLFFQFRDTKGAAKDIDIIAAKAPRPESDSAAVALLRRAGEHAKEVLKDGGGVDRFVSSLKLDWKRRIEISKATELLSYIFAFLRRAKELLG